MDVNLTCNLRYHNKVALVTGGSKGIGEGTVRVFVRNGAKVAFCARGEEAGKKLESEVNQLGPGECFFIKCDVQKEDDIKRTIQSTIDKFGQLDCLINNAGWHPPEQVIDDISVDDLKSLLNFNLINYFAFAKYSLPHLRKTKGNIINMSSLVAKLGQSHAIPYVCTKGAIDAFSRALAIDEAKHGVRVNTVSPGNIWTPLWDSLARQSSNPEAMVEGGRDAQLNGRFGSIEESGQVCLFLAAEATFTTGIDFLLSGGAELNYGRKSQMVERTNIYD
ncbi:17-beta-hydroxysteroid dehydrogenase 14-like [Anneissia japonica]|uniref:17-beta-hydroxysteroid dehydrogenase 14-like n=1 Tax=Anneissia japonica TaxID=1529436 RepID=UPI0014258C73|nr:17-beta-hydroxysteroid dehydrogenase 14-like [Anneissia japonica]